MGVDQNNIYKPNQVESLQNRTKRSHPQSRILSPFATNSSSATEIGFELFYLKDLLKLWNDLELGSSTKKNQTKNATEPQEED